ncbi:hypothetical protein AM588_10005605 [Phytophthora nicotianae]|uniref:Cyclin N-terminal domain-containing protein n=1 Tax=Phytophthora nicotianae TaxID=4792 RepID=A0A0W8D148_PHYNI|nr:hypothetical protein AM588_10005605 [Phytophthora nicotianae]
MHSETVAAAAAEPPAPSEVNAETSTADGYNGNETTARRRRFASISGLALERPSPTHYDWRGTSYFRLLHATWSACDPDRDREDAHPERVPFSANFLDDPEFRQGRHRHRLNLEVATVALACVLFEKLVLQHYVTKANRKLYMAVCFLLAVKFNEPCASDERKRVIRLLLEDFDRAHALPSRDVLTAEFTVYAQLSFNLHVPIAEVHPHFVRLLKLIESNPRKYLDDDIFTSYSALLAMEEQAENLGMVLSDPLDGFDETTDGEARLSDEEDDASEKDGEQRGRKRKNSGERGKGSSGDPSMFPWHNVSFTQWWRKRRSPRERHESASTAI